MKNMRISTRTSRIVALAVLGLLVLAMVPRSASADTVQSTDFQSQSFTKVVDWYDYVRQYAAANGITPPPWVATAHAYLYTNYINVGGFQLFYVGLINATNPTTGNNVTVPLQSFFEHFKTPGGKDAITASSFLSLIAFTENSSTIYPNSPDRNDTIYASFSLGGVSAFGTPVASSRVIPLTSPAPNQWTWGLKYTNLNAVWWKIGVDPLFPFWDNRTARGVAQYDELTFNYALTIDPAAKTAQLTASYTIGKVTSLWTLTPSNTSVCRLSVCHYNSTGTYDINGARLPGPAGQVTVYDFLQTGGYKLSIVLANKAILASHTVVDKTDTNTSVDDSDANATRTAVTTSSDDGERVFKADFSTKPTYQLYNSTDANPQPYNVTVRTVRRGGWGGNPVFAFQNAFMGFMPLFVAHVDPALFQAARAGMASFSVSDYLYTISYPQWGGTRIVNDPDFTAFYQPTGNAGLLTAIFIAVAVAAGIGGIFAFLFRRKRTASVGFTGATGNTPQGPTPSGPAIPGR